MSTKIEEITQQQTQQHVTNQSQIPTHTNVNHHRFPPSPLNTFPPPLNLPQQPYYTPPTQYPNQLTNIYNSQYANPYQTPTQHTQKQYKTQTQHTEKPVIIPVKLKRSKTLKNKDKQLLSALQKRYPLASQYGRIEFSINLFEELDSDDDTDIIIDTTNTEIKDNTDKDIKPEKKKK
eukprot:132982_1